MKTAFIIYIKAVGIYALLTIPALMLPPMYLISMMIVLIYGWFAWALFTVIYVTIVFCNFDYAMKMVILVIGVIASVAFAFQMLEILKVEEDVWHSGFLIFPIAGVVAGWISLIVSRRKIESSSRDLLLNIPVNQNTNGSNLV